MRISDWSSDVCSSDLGYLWRRPQPHTARYRRRRRRLAADDQGRGGRAALPADRRHPRTPLRPTGTGNPKPLMTALSVAIKRLDHAADLALPAYATADSAGLHLPAAVEPSIRLAPGQRALNPVGTAETGGSSAWGRTGPQAEDRG